VEAAELLCELGSDIDFVDENMNNLLMIAIIHDCTQAAKFLIDRGIHFFIVILI
jgi:ankyrin repeat protein